ncbi:MAG TPA: hypothetical protein VIG74_00805 [Alphaproteobacteria bacterium]|jgi:hypothetical protein
MMQKFTTAFFLLTLLILTACSPHSLEHNSLPGHWTGVEGTALDIASAENGFTVTITNLDGPRSFPAAPTPAGIAFTRDGENLTIRPGTGADTGMKWLADKKDCVTVAPHEGYCRD